ncbi:hypothetical protein WH47_06293 [Habropoda laboriosa]|uniref:Uncharacterized protein n=1 Tax=Habropoda laboriosa TaxID=597456 RepID=A0A0L7QJ90_9HYME|nr:hypothetical protein WH47_06293 [Habropoda laboriosa]
MKYLGLHLDSPWSFEPHFRPLGPGVRRLYVGIVRSMALYGAPICQ